MSDTELSADYVSRFYGAVKSKIDLTTFGVYTINLQTDIDALPNGEYKTEAVRLLHEIEKGGYIIQKDNVPESLEKFVLPPIQRLLDLVKANDLKEKDRTSP